MMTRETVSAGPHFLQERRVRSTPWPSGHVPHMNPTVGCMNNHSKTCQEKQGNNKTQQKGNATQHNSPEAVILQRKLATWHSNYSTP